MTTTKRVIEKEEWDRKLAEVKVNKEDLNRLVMDYLVIEGYKDAAEKFSIESGLKPNVDLESIQERMHIRSAVHAGDIEAAMERVNDLNPDILDTNPQLYFHLQQQRLIELIRANRVNEALEFASEELASRGEEQPEFLSEFERTMALLAFDANASGLANPVSDLLQYAKRQQTAQELNAAILESQSQERDPKLPSLLKMLVWSQQQLDERMTFPQLEIL
ncbi:hypothetical protein BZG36_03114 [Bifiguratus adelaidae]|uniref:CTLH domain-containing protein n=1 Tax=Bifiguratus adelaidae TaxID=1938954 RepID=A0A261Y0Y8_9FUNG|nr:hypothetical protein BZG36_03114 [Bifiguratus adelaidae]